MDLAAFVADGVAVSRRVKPRSRPSAADGIPVRHELEFALVLDGSVPEESVPEDQGPEESGPEEVEGDGGQTAQGSAESGSMP